VNRTMVRNRGTACKAIPKTPIVWTHRDAVGEGDGRRAAVAAPAGGIHADIVRRRLHGPQVEIAFCFLLKVHRHIPAVQQLTHLGRCWCVAVIDLQVGRDSAVRDEQMEGYHAGGHPTVLQLTCWAIRRYRSPSIHRQ